MSQSNIRLHDLKVEEIPVASLKRASRNARLHSKAQVKQIVASFREFGVVTPIVVDETNMILAGHGRLEAANSAGLLTLPVVRVTGLSDGQCPSSDNLRQRGRFPNGGFCSSGVGF